MDVVIRADSSTWFGSGHIMRCLTIAQALRSRGARVEFVCRQLKGNLNSYITAKGFLVHELEDTFNPELAPEEGGWSRTTWAADAAQTIRVLTAMSIKPQLLIVDHYGLDAGWEAQLKPFVDKLMVIDDLANRPHRCDYLLDQNFYDNYEQRYHQLVPPGCVKLLGPQYALLRREFTRLQRKAPVAGGSGIRILVFMGGGDSSDETSKVLTALDRTGRQDIVADVVVGMNNPHREKIAAQVSTRPNWNYFCQVENLAEMMREADLAIGAGGTSSWERCSAGLPTLVVIVAANQQEVADKLVKEKLAVLGGYAGGDYVDFMAEQIIMLLDNPQLLRDMSARCMQIVDGCGVRRVVDVIMGAENGA
ncbi:MAG TPA: UDP-2,4-diacetamido-2,4,6-trideoxy-beta-L-altropyranose hydrolase [Bacillota bacterium]|nr:UDP-2,4-diacetamido-2,4,6-trideoxy-beta-L-altropyranose hydrolase [Bacillota bacterium]